MVWGAIIGAGISLYSGYKSSSASKKAAGKERARARAGANLRKLKGGQEREAIRDERAMLQSRIELGAAASGVTLSGSVMTALVENAQNAASEEVRSAITQEKDVERILKGGQYQAAALRDRAQAQMLNGFAGAIQGISNAYQSSAKSTS